MTRLYNAKILREDFTIIENGALLTDGGVITKICEHFCKQDCGAVFEQDIDCEGNLLIPSFKNAHTHSGMTFLRSRADDMPLQEWLQTQIWPQEAKLTPDHVYWFTKLAILEYLSGGITAAFDMYMKPEAIASAARDTGFRITLCGSVMDFDGEGAVQRMADDYNKYKNTGLVDYRLGFHAEYTNSIDNMREIAAVSRQYNAPVYCHMSETFTEHNECVRRHGKTPAALFAELGLWDVPGAGVFHAVHVTDNDIAIMAERGVWAISNPGSNLKLASGIAPLTKLNQEMNRVALGTDGPASNNALSMFREMYLACTLQKHLCADAAACPALNALRWATANSAAAMGLADCDCLAPGKNADIVMIDLSRPSMRPLNNPAKNLVYSGDSSCVKMTMVGGVIRYMDGEFFVGEDSDGIIEKAESLMSDFT
jgi:5-methylthioadenosine/S-adenosylhomocysteine deaminase